MSSQGQVTWRLSVTVQVGLELAYSKFACSYFLVSLSVFPVFRYTIRRAIYLFSLIPTACVITLNQQLGLGLSLRFLGYDLLLSRRLLMHDNAGGTALLPDYRLGTRL